jgi:hypothetical protein
MSLIVKRAKFLFVLFVARNPMLPPDVRSWRNGMKSAETNPKLPIGY